MPRLKLDLQIIMLKTIRLIKLVIIFQLVLCQGVRSENNNSFVRCIKESVIFEHSKIEQFKIKTSYLQDRKKTIYIEYNDDRFVVINHADDSLFHYIDIAKLNIVFAVPKNWNKSTINDKDNILFSLYKKVEEGYLPNINGLAFSFPYSLEQYLEHKISKAKEYNGDLIYRSHLPIFCEEKNALLMLRVSRENINITFFSFVFIDHNYLVELNLSCDTKDERLYEILINEMIAKIECKNILQAQD